ncbi:MAG TPA: hypothetical protein VHX40_02190 [Acidimicrobiales bacterium]|jgi:hypothetical protein|nr:hypothetical protein [Acidimicrobiales bacterium]
MTTAAAARTVTENRTDVDTEVDADDDAADDERDRGVGREGDAVGPVADGATTPGGRAGLTDGADQPA